MKNKIRQQQEKMRMNLTQLW